ncbi:Smr/MutS family protein [Inmirania thermothiophila]|uniref:DNA-nicking Smr family endonuclease n=1 Tax=Inmirania thermothiophila TaxID=1750597 RepID=A0A3N1Y3S5_9GAMM|nr:Smr/MutS family protein [Inmirania thermothiophila]ROR32242.1 DNA-nicking Smr family endonuclease [Inmirania thermothiophila]
MPVDDEDRALFRRAVRGARRLTPERAEVRGPRPPPRALQSAAEREAVLRASLSHSPLALEVETGEEVVFLRPGLDRRILRRLRRGHYAVGDQIDLHGLRADEAREALAAFLRRSLGRGVRCVRVIHGKGLRSPGGEPVLRRAVPRWLARRDEVLAFCSAPPADGGLGALYVLLRGG